MQISLGQSVYSSDKQKLGTIDRVIVNPVGNYVAHLVVHRGIFLDDDKLVARDEIALIDAAGVHLTIDGAAARQLPRFEHTYAGGDVETVFRDVIPGPYQSMLLFSTPPVGQVYQGSEILFRLDPSGEGAELSNLNLEPNEVILGKAAEVVGSDGTRVGLVHDLAYANDGTLAAVIVQTGVLRHHSITIDADMIAQIGDDEILLNVPASALSRVVG